ncbi:MAG: glycosyltransferase [Candidatus Abyssobacteria bacterium SURF_5]|uniref:Glycosyltransferase n=1 Tax=Abyssobacteria bacterium (strain SURF_5) TaxID=2093360 RepID=A0A3A4PC01_ABYX5|nr:MAG: glycosyltransferase [Candidatus Abyssubacteria bacterium SURF_5]
MKEASQKDTRPLNATVVVPVPREGHYHYTTQLCNALVKDRGIGKLILTLIFTTKEAGEKEFDLLAPEVEIFILSPYNRNRIIRLLITLLNFARYVFVLKRNKIRTAHIHSTTEHWYLDLFLHFLFKLLQIKIVRTVHEVNRERIASISPMERRSADFLLRKSDAVIVHNERTARLLEEERAIPRSRMEVIPHGNYLLFTTFSKNTAAEAHPGNEHPTILFFGFKRHKGLELFIEACKEMQIEGHHFNTVIAGVVNPGDEDLIERAKGFESARLLPGYISNEEIWKIFQDVDVVILPYLSGTTSGALHLAYAFGKATLISDLPCFLDVALPEQTSLVVKTGDKKALKEGMIRLLQDDQLRGELARKGLERESSSEFAWPEIARKTIDLFAGLCTRVPGNE